jgi:hypothetical protein
MKLQRTQNGPGTQHHIAVDFKPATTFTKTVNAPEGTYASHLPFEFGFRNYTVECLAEFNEFKQTLTAELAEKYAELLDLQGVRYAVNEADALAAFTPFPSLFLPVLAEEKVQAASQWNARQRAIRSRSLEMAA